MYNYHHYPEFFLYSIYVIPGYSTEVYPFWELLVDNFNYKNIDN